MTPNDLLVGAYRMARELVRGMCADLTPEEFHHQPVSGANTAAWIVGHLALTAHRTAKRLGATDLPELPEDFVERFRATRKPVAGEQKGIGEKEELLAQFGVGVEKLMEVLRRVPVESLSGPAPSPSPPFVSTSGELLLFGAMHVTMHCGQLSTIRRSLGKPPLV